MKKNLNISPIGLKGNQINERIKELMGMSPINENTSSIVIELTKLGPDGKAYAIVRENHEHYIKISENKNNLIAEDFKYIGGLQNKKSEAYPSYSNAIKHLNMKFKSLAEAHNFEGEINVFQNDNLIKENSMGGFPQMEGNGFSEMARYDESSEIDDIKSAIESAIGGSVEPVGEDPNGNPIYGSNHDINLQFYIGPNNSIVKKDKITGQEIVMGHLHETNFPDLTGDGESLYEDMPIEDDYNDELSEEEQAIQDMFNREDGALIGKDYTNGLRVGDMNEGTLKKKVLKK